MVRNGLRNLSLYYYTTACAGLLILLTMTVTKIFVTSHPLRYMFLALLCLGLAPGYLRYRLRVSNKRHEGADGPRRYALLLTLIAAYIGFRSFVRNFARHEVSGNDYGVAMGFFILGLFLAYYGLYTVYLWKNRHEIAAGTGRLPRS